MGRSKEALKRRHGKRMARRRAIKAAKKALYDAKIAAGKNRKPKRTAKAASGKTISPVRVFQLMPVLKNGAVVQELRKVHGGAACRNVGCKKCSAVARLAA